MNKYACNTCKTASVVEAFANTLKLHCSKCDKPTDHMKVKTTAAGQKPFISSFSELLVPKHETIELPAAAVAPSNKTQLDVKAVVK